MCSGPSPYSAVQASDARVRLKEERDRPSAGGAGEAQAVAPPGVWVSVDTPKWSNRSRAAGGTLSWRRAAGRRPSSRARRARPAAGGSGSARRRCTSTWGGAAALRATQNFEHTLDLAGGALQTCVASGSYALLPSARAACSAPKLGTACRGQRDTRRCLIVSAGGRDGDARNAGAFPARWLARCRAIATLPRAARPHAPRCGHHLHEKSFALHGSRRGEARG